jgi:hypothetical protein
MNFSMTFTEFDFSTQGNTKQVYTFSIFTTFRTRGGILLYMTSTLLFHPISMLI